MSGIGFIVSEGTPTAWGGRTVRLTLAPLAEPQSSGFIATPPRNAKIAKFRKRSRKCAACCAYTDTPCAWALCPQREIA